MKMKLKIFYDNGTSYTVNKVGAWHVNRTTRNIVYKQKEEQSNNVSEQVFTHLYQSVTNDVAAVMEIDKLPIGTKSVRVEIYNPNNFHLVADVQRIQSDI